MKRGIFLEISGRTDHLLAIPAKEQMDLGLNFVSSLPVILTMRWYAN